MQAKLAMKKAQETSQAISDALREVGIHVNPKKTDAKDKRGTLPKTFKIDEQEQPLDGDHIPRNAIGQVPLTSTAGSILPGRDHRG